MISPVQLPPAVRPGARVGVAALSAPPAREELARGVAALGELGFEPVLAENLQARHGVFAGSDRERLAAFHRLVADPDLGAVFFARGGHGVLRILPEIDWNLLRHRPRAYIGYSDLTPFLLEVVRRLGLAAFHGPLVAVDLARGLSSEERRSLLAALAGELPVELPGRGMVGRGSAEGPLLGGCLSLLTSIVGTPHAPDLAGAILFWEDVAEPVYRLDRMLTHLQLSGNLTALSGMVVGQVSVPEDAESGEDCLREVLEELASRLSIPIAVGVPSGHCRPNLTLPLGLRARIEAAGDQVLVRIA